MVPSCADQLQREILMARQRIYTLSGPTPLHTLNLPGGVRVFLKREDLTPIHAYKWRGAYNRMAVLSAEEIGRGVVTASAGNHAQGVALAARRLATRATVFMPLPTPRTKQAAVKHHGGDHVEIVLMGDTYDDASQTAYDEAAARRCVFVHPYDDLLVMGGQGTLADEIVISGHGPFDVAYVQIGGGGMASAVACWLKSYYPKIRIIGVEGVDQACMAAAVAAGEPVALDYVDVFCDGTAVKRAGGLTFPICRDLIDQFITVTNDEVCAAIQLLWERHRCIPEPAGAMGLAGILKNQAQLRGKKVIAIICGANMDFDQLAWIARHAEIGAARYHYLRFEIEERKSILFDLLETLLTGLNIVEFQYGKSHSSRAWPVIGFEASPAEYKLLTRRLQESGIPYEDVTSQEDVDFGIIHYESDLMHLPHFIKLEFHERPNALHDFLKTFSPHANLCYFSYRYTGERVGRALIGFEFANEQQRQNFKDKLGKKGSTYRYCKEIPPLVLERILGSATSGILK